MHLLQFSDQERLQEKTFLLEKICSAAYLPCEEYAQYLESKKAFMSCLML